VKREDETTFRWWTFGHTAPWIAVLQVIAALAQERFDTCKLCKLQSRLKIRQAMKKI